MLIMSSFINLHGNPSNVNKSSRLHLLLLVQMSFNGKYTGWRYIRSTYSFISLDVFFNQIETPKPNTRRLRKITNWFIWIDIIIFSINNLRCHGLIRKYIVSTVASMCLAFPIRSILIFNYLVLILTCSGYNTFLSTRRLSSNTSITGWERRRVNSSISPWFTVDDHYLTFWPSTSRK